MKTLADFAAAVTGGNLTTATKLLNDVGAEIPEEWDPDPSTPVARVSVVELIAVRAGDLVGRRAVLFLRDADAGGAWA